MFPVSLKIMLRGRLQEGVADAAGSARCSETTPERSRKAGSNAARPRPRWPDRTAVLPCRPVRMEAERRKRGDGGNGLFFLGSKVPTRPQTQGPKVALATARFRTIAKTLSSASARPTEIPQVRAATAFPTGFPQTKRHSPAHGGTPANVAL